MQVEMVMTSDEPRKALPLALAHDRLLSLPVECEVTFRLQTTTTLLSTTRSKPLKLSEYVRGSSCTRRLLLASALMRREAQIDASDPQGILK